MPEELVNQILWSSRSPRWRSSQGTLT